MNQSSLKCFATRTTNPPLKLKRPILLVMCSTLMPFAAVLMINTSLP